MFNKITIIGLGLIGGSLALAIKEKKLAKEIAGVSRRKSTIKEALKNKIVDSGTLDLEDGVKDSDFIIIATPVFKIVSIAKRVARFLKKGAILTDVGSTKRHIVRSIEKAVPKGIDFVGSHPIAGSERSGIKSANKDLFKNACCILTKTKKTNPKAIGKVKKFWENLGIEVIIMRPQMHDKALSKISHLSHAVSASLVNSVGKSRLDLAAGGFKDATRVASGEPELWRDIFLTNKDNLIKDIGILKKELNKVEAALRNNDQAGLLRLLHKAKVVRDSI